jgi:hypothetical protein
MRYLLSAAFLVSSTGIASAALVQVPEIDAMSGLAALGLVGAVSALIWERRRR